MQADLPKGANPRPTEPGVLPNPVAVPYPGTPNDFIIPIGAPPFPSPPSALPCFLSPPLSPAMSCRPVTVLDDSEHGGHGTDPAG